MKRVDEKDLLKWSCKRINELFMPTDVVVDTWYNYNNGKDMTIDVTLKFTIPEKNIALLDNHLADVSEQLKDLTEEV